MQYSAIATRLELHYFFISDTHSLNAFLRNRSEYELLQIIRELSFLLDIQFEIEAEALKEGGLREIWKFIGDNSNQLTVVILLATFILSLVPKHDSALDAVKIQDLKLSIEERKLNIEKLKHELHKLKEDTAEEISYELNKDIKLIKHRSNFYKNLLEDKKIKQISFRALDDNDKVLPGYEYPIPIRDLKVDINRDKLFESNQIKGGLCYVHIHIVPCFWAQGYSV